MRRGRSLEELLREESFSSQKTEEREKENKIKELEEKGFALENKDEELLYEGCRRVALLKKGETLFFLLKFPHSFLLCCDYYYSRYKGDGRYSEMIGKERKNSDREG